jgi:hypothetical protein
METKTFQNTNETENVPAAEFFHKHQRAEAELKEAKEFLSSVIDNVPNLIFVKDSDRKFTLANCVVAEIYETTVN